MARIQLVEPYELAQWIDDDSNGIFVMDVRDSDYYGYKIPGSRNIPANQFGQNCSKSRIVSSTIYCQTVNQAMGLSQQRPKLFTK
ncbi:MAG: hypothetical protein EZS28_016201 [Streblomastix strix]|uniref:Rhodanese domain-containing protein n=1 Tax=Streblomastix strix TaxID=222440 RepID=A0A5J4W0W5_9EUKA|nr:MAG: hypothetical protein EZS28_016201 [Streblomastix strix]